MHDSPWKREASSHVRFSLSLQEMSPIDLVPMAPQAHEETFFDTTQGDIGYVNRAFSSSVERPGPVPRRVHNGHMKHHVSYLSVGVKAQVP